VFQRVDALARGIGVRHDDVPMNVQIEARSEALAERDGRAFGALEAEGLSLLALPALDLLDEDATDRRERVWLCSEQEPELKWNGQDPLPQRHVGSDDIIHQVRGGVRHASGVARWTDAAELAREGQEQVVAAGLADGTGEAVRMQAALEVAPELVLHVLRQPLCPSSRARARGSFRGAAR
jgi:hypothetical protein